MSECQHDWGLYSGYFLVTTPGVKEFKYICFKCGTIHVEQRTYVRS